MMARSPAHPMVPAQAVGTPLTRALESRVLKFIQERDVFSPGEAVVVAVSGGPDSTALLMILSRLRKQLGLRLTAAHFDHMLRSRAEAADDVAFVRGLADSLDVPFVASGGDVASRARRKRESTEDAARRMRYRFLARAARDARATSVAVGHTVDDHAESVLLHLLRGSGLDGLVGMRARSSWPFGRGPDVVRPLLSLSRKETQRYCREVGMEPRRDPTNDLLLATRNKVRHRLIPILREFNPRTEQALSRLGEALASDREFIESAAGVEWQRLAKRDAGTVSFARGELASMHPALATRLVRRAYEHIAGGKADLEGVHVHDVLSLLGKRRARLSLPHGVTAVVNPEALTLTKDEPQGSPPLPQTALKAPGRTQAGGWLIDTEFVDPPADPTRQDSMEAFVDADATGPMLTVSSRQPGDRLRPLGLGGEKKLQDILVDAKVPAEERDDVLILRGENGIIWVAGLCIDERYALTSHSSRALRIRIRVD